MPLNSVYNWRTSCVYCSLRLARAAERADGARGKAFTRAKRAKNFQLINYSCRRGQLINGVGLTHLRASKSLSPLTEKLLLIILPMRSLIESRQCER